jgi:hypothetical protein
MNKVMKTLAGVAAAVAAASAATSASAVGWTIELKGTVQLVCKAELTQSAAPSGSGVVTLGPLNELCNDGNGFEVYATTPAGTGGAFLVDGKSVPVSSSGQTVIDASPSAVIMTHQLAYDPQGGQAPSSVTISVVAN